MPKKKTKKKAKGRQTALSEALDQVIAAIREGASPLKVTKGTADLIRVRLEDDFTAAIETWPKFEEAVLRKAFRHGRRAALLTLAKWANGGGSGKPPKVVDQQLCDIAGYLVSRVDCPTESKRGRFCRNYAYFGSEDAEKELKPVLKEMNQNR